MSEFSLSRTAMELLQINEEFMFHVDDRHIVKISDFELYDFEQLWSNTSGGFEGMGGSAMTTQRTYVLYPISCDEDAHIYFGGVFAYKAPISAIFDEDIRNRNIAGKSSYSKYFV